MSHPDDHIRIVHMNGKTATYFCSSLGLDWPPPKKVRINGLVYERVRMSELTDDEIFKMSNVARGAEYKPYVNE